MFVSKKTISGHESPLESLDGRPSGNLHGAEPTPRQAGQEPLHFEEPSQALESLNFSSRCGDVQQPPSFAPKSRQEVQLLFSYGHKYGTASLVSSGKGYQRGRWRSRRSSWICVGCWELGGIWRSSAFRNRSVGMDRRAVPLLRQIRHYPHRRDGLRLFLIHFLSKYNKYFAKYTNV